MRRFLKVPNIFNKYTKIARTQNLKIKRERQKGSEGIQSDGRAAVHIYKTIK